MHNPQTEGFSSVCPSVQLLILPLTFRSMSHFKFILNKFLKTICIFPQLRVQYSLDYFLIMILVCGEGNVIKWSPFERLY